MTLTTDTTTATSAPARILIVEDEAVIAMDMAQHLRDFGYEVVGIAASGDRARELAAQCHPDLIMMDIVIKGLSDGIETARAIRTDADIPVVFLTAYGDRPTLERAKAASPHGYLLKPFRPNDLRTTIEVALHKQALEARVRQSEHWLKKTLQCIGDGVIATDPQGCVRFMNPVAERLVGTSAEAAQGRPAREVFLLRAEAGDAELPDLLQQALQGNELTPVCRGLLHGGGDEPRLYVDAGAAPIRDDDGLLLGGVVVMRDVTQRRLDEQELLRYREHLETLVRDRTSELEAAKREAERSNHAMVEFMTSISHELRTPLNAVIGFSQLLGMEPMTERQGGFVRHVHDAGAHMLRLIEDLLDLAKIDAGRLVVQCVPVDVSTVVTQAVPLVASLVAERAIVLTVEPPNAPLSVAADPTRLTQVLVNLLSNAIKYNRKGGQVRVSCRMQDNARVRIAVSDTGSGIAHTKQARLFRSFERLGAETSGITGAGIGLAFSKRLASLMQGDLGFETEVGVGSTFWIELRLWSEDRAASAPQA
jgi:PAS domain S-box-containing protein